MALVADRTMENWGATRDTGGDSSWSRGRNRPVIVAVIAMRVVEVPVDDVVRMVAVGYRFMTTIRSVNVVRIVTAASVSYTHLTLPTKA